MACVWFSTAFIALSFSVMLDQKSLRNNLEDVVAVLKRRGVEFDREAYCDAEDRRKALQTRVEALRGESKLSAKAVGKAKAGGTDASKLLRAGEAVKQQLAALEGELSKAQAALDAVLSGVPNLPDAAAPDGKEESDNLELRSWGEKPTFGFDVKDHLAIAERLGLMSSGAAANLAGSRFMVLFGEVAELHRALARFMLELQTEQHGYREVCVPYIVNAGCLYGTGQLPKFEEDLFALAGGSGYYLIPTAEVPLTNLYRDTIIDDGDLPIKLVAQTPCFRSEAGSYGKDTRGLIRQHQFEKIEMVHIVRSEDSAAALEELTGHAEAVLQALELPYRVVELCTGDLGFAASRTYDLEVWLPAQQRYREVSSCSNMTDFQARRMKARVRKGKRKPELVHTLNGSGLAVGRTLAAVLENCQTDEGEVRVPGKLVPYMGGREIIERAGV